MRGGGGGKQMTESDRKQVSGFVSSLVPAFWMVLVGPSDVVVSGGGGEAAVKVVVVGQVCVSWLFWTHVMVARDTNRLPDMQTHHTQRKR